MEALANKTGITPEQIYKYRVPHPMAKCSTKPVHYKFNRDCKSSLFQTVGLSNLGRPHEGTRTLLAVCLHSSDASPEQISMEAGTTRRVYQKGFSKTPMIKQRLNRGKPDNRRTNLWISVSDHFHSSRSTSSVTNSPSTFKSFCKMSERIISHSSRNASCKGYEIQSLDR